MMYNFEGLEEEVVKTILSKGVFVLIDGLEEYYREDLQKSLTTLHHKGLIHQIGDNIYEFTDKGEQTFKTLAQ